MCASSAALMAVRVSAVSDESADIRSFELRALNGDALPAFQAGDHIDVVTPSGLVRQYSLANMPGQKHYEIGVKLEANSRGGSMSLHTQVKVGDVLKISAPRSNFALENACRHVLLAGGIGITPLLSMASVLHAAGGPVTVHYFIRSRSHAAYLARLEAMNPGVTVHLHENLDPEATAHRLRQDAAEQPAGTLVYTCGPAPFMEAVKTIYGVVLGDQAIHLEYFQPREDVATSRAAFRVYLAKTGEEVQVDADQTILEALAAHGLKVPTSCMQGVCGTCVTRVLEGVPDHRDSFLSEFHRKNNKKIAICVSRAKTEHLVLDL